MSPRSHVRPPTPAALRAVRRIALAAGQRVSEVRRRRRWSIATLADRAGMSDAHAAQIEAGEVASLEFYARLMIALDLEPQLAGVDRRSRRTVSFDDADFVHAAMAEVEARHVSAFGLTVAIDEPYQHYQFAGRADVVAWDLAARVLLHIENRTRSPDVQDSLGSYGSKRAYLGRVLAERLGLRGPWRSETHVIAALWSSEVLHVLRIREGTFRAACPDDIGPAREWWAGRLPARSGVTSSLVLFDPGIGVRAPYRLGEVTTSTRPRYRGYADCAEALRGGQPGQSGRK